MPHGDAVAGGGACGTADTATAETRAATRVYFMLTTVQLPVERDKLHSTSSEWSYTDAAR